MSGFRPALERAGSYCAWWSWVQSIQTLCDLLSGAHVKKTPDYIDSSYGSALDYVLKNGDAILEGLQRKLLQP